MKMKTILDDASSVLDCCLENHWHIASAESLTGGLLADSFVSVPGASRVFLGSAVTYDIHAKAKILGVDVELLKSRGAVDARVARLMALGAARLYSGSEWDYVYKGYVKDLRNPDFPVIGLSTTGVAGPGPDGDKPAGLAYVGIFLPQVVAEYIESSLNSSIYDLLCLNVDENIKSCADSDSCSSEKPIFNRDCLEDYFDITVDKSVYGTLISSELHNSGNREEVRNSVVAKLLKLLHLLLCEGCGNIERA